jgi:hypothetical protein
VSLKDGYIKESFMNSSKNWLRDLALEGARHVLIDIEKRKLEIYKRFPELNIEVINDIPNKSKRSKYSDKFKNKVMSEAKTTGKVTDTAQKYKVPRSVLTKWLSK